MAENNSPRLQSRHAAGDIAARPKLGAFRDSDVAQAVVRKMVEGQTIRPLNIKGNYQTPQPDNSLVFGVTDRTASRIVDNQNMMQLLPEIELIKQILISGILSPNDMMSQELTFHADAPLLGDLQSAMLTAFEDFFKNTQQIESTMADELEAILFKTGAFVQAILPESTLDDAINSPDRVSTTTLEAIRTGFSAEGHSRNMGILGPKTRDGNARASLGLESLHTPSRADVDSISSVVGLEGMFLRVSDNPDTLKVPFLKEKIAADRIADALSLRRLSTEARTEDNKALNDLQLRRTLYKPRQYVNTPVLNLKPASILDKPTVGHPLVMVLPAESVIPVHVPGNPDDHVAYFVLLDQTGNPISKATVSDYYTDLANNVTRNKDMVSQMLNQTRRATDGGMGKPEDFMNVQAGTNLYMDIVEQELNDRLKNGVYGDNAKVARPQEVYRIMFARACQKMYTQLLLIPAQLMVYAAFDYNEHGCGRSLLENNRIIGSLRAMTLFANTMAAIKNSTGHVELNIDLDPNDPDPDHTIEMALHEHMRTRGIGFPVGVANPLDLINFLQAAGVTVTVQGHPGYPATKISQNDISVSRTKVDTDFDDSLKKRFAMGLGVAPETVELSMGVDFATSIIQSNLMLAKRALIMGKRYTFFKTDYCRKFAYNSQALMDILRDIVKTKPELVTKLDPKNEYGVDGLVTYFISKVETSLPEPNLKGIEIQMQAFDIQTSAIEKAIPAFVSSELFDSSLIGELGGSIPTVIAVIKAYLQRRWLRENNVLPELFELFTYGDEDKKIFDIMELHKEHLDSISVSLIPFLKQINDSKKKTDEIIQKIGGVEENSNAGQSSTTSSTTDEGGGDDQGGGDDLGGGDFDFGAPPEEDAAAEDENAEDKGGDKGGTESAADTAADKGAAEEPPAEGT